MKVLFVTNMFPTASQPYSGIHVARQAQSLERAGVSVAVEVIAGSRGAADYFVARSRVRNQLRSGQPDICHAHFGYTLLACAGLHRPLVVTLHGDDVNGTSNGRGGITLKSRIGAGVTNMLAGRADRIVVQSEAMRDRLRPAVRPGAEVLPCGIDEELFSPGDRDAARIRLGLPRDATLLCFVNSGRQPTKRLDLAEATSAELGRRGRGVQLLVADSVPVDEMPWYYRASDCLLMTSDLEGSPTCVKEALASGIPVVSVPVGDVSLVLDEARRGLVVSRSPRDLAAAVESVLAMPRSSSSLLPEYLRAARVADRLIRIYRELLAGRP